MAITVTPGLVRAPKVVQHLAGVLAERGIALDETPSPCPQTGSRLLVAVTPIGRIRVSRVRGVWSIELAPTGMTEYVDVGVWDACVRGTPLGIVRPSLTAQASWIQDLLAQPTGLPPFDAACLREWVAERRRRPVLVTGMRLWLMVVVALPAVVAGLWVWSHAGVPTPAMGAMVVVCSLVVAMAVSGVALRRSRGEVDSRR